MKDQNRDQNSYQGFKEKVLGAILESTHKIPRWLQKGNGPSLSERPFSQKLLELDSLEGEGTAKNTASGRPPYRMRTFKQVKRRLAEMEELHDWVEKKASKHEDLEGTKEGKLLDGLEHVLNSMVE